MSQNNDDQELIAFFKTQGINQVKKLEDGEWVGVVPLMFSTSVCCGMDRFSVFKYRWCFKHQQDALDFFTDISCFDDIPADLDALVGHRYIHKPLVMVKDELGLDKW